MRILLLAATDPPDTGIAACAPGWAAAGHEATVIAGARGGGWHARETRDGVRIVRVRPFVPAGPVAAALARAPDIFAASLAPPAPALAGWASAVLRRRPFVLEAGAGGPSGQAGSALWLCRRAQAVVVGDGAAKTELTAAGIVPNKIAVVPEGPRRAASLLAVFDLVLAGAGASAAAYDTLLDPSGCDMVGRPTGETPT